MTADRLASRSRGAAAPPAGRRGDPGGLPDPVPHRPGREAAGLPRLRRHLAEAAPGARRRALVLRERQRRAAPGCPPARRGGDRRLRGGPGHHRRVHRRARAGDRLHPQHHRGDQPRGLRALQRRDGEGGGVPHLRRRPGRRDRGHRDGAPRQPAAVAAAVRAHRGDPALARPHRRRPAGPLRPDHGDQRAHQARRGHPAVEPPGHDQPARRDHRPRARGRGAGPGRRRAVGAALADRRRRARRGLPGVLRAQDARAHRRRRAVGPLRRPRQAAAVPDRRLDDRGRADGGQHLRRPAAALRGRRAR